MKFWLLILPFALCAQEPTESKPAEQKKHKSPEQIEQELQAAEAKLDRAKKMFNPWYAGPLVTPSASMMPVGSANIQPYFFITANYAVFDKDRHSVPLAHNSYQFSVVAPMQVGITDSTDLVVNPSALANWQNKHSGGGFGDLAVTYGFKIQGETLYIPKFKFTITEILPTGRYKNLIPTGLNDSGAGAFQTQFGLATGKVIWWSYPYPMNTRLFVGYTIATMVNVSGFNNYGGGFGTKGRVRPGNILTADFGYELSFSQRWVFALDVVYRAQNSTKFHGKLGVGEDGKPASVGGGYNDNLSLAPAIEYNFSDSFQMLWGVQFSVYGRNSSNFCNGQLSFEYTW
jgi:hypothetical protein